MFKIGKKQSGLAVHMKCVLKKVIFWKQIIHQRSESVECVSFLGQTNIGNCFSCTRRYFFCGSLVLFVSCVSHAFASVHCYLVVTRWQRADLLALVCDVYCIFRYFPMWYPGSGVVLDCIVS